jgi:hypothetical protein
MTRRTWALVVFLLPAVVGCSSVNQAIQSAGRTAGRTVGEAAGRAVGQRIVRSYTPQFASMYASYMFTYAFTPGGYWIEPTPYRPGDYTKWRFIEDSQPNGSWLEKAFLKKTAEGQEWWRVTMYDADSEDTVVLEALFDAERTTVLRLRSQFPGEEIREMPVEQGTMVYSRPMELTPESLQGATVETGSVTVPGGTFTARHVRFGDVSTGGTVEWWLTDSVPGGVVRYGNSSRTQQEEVEGLSDSNFFLELTEKGSGATTKLNSY